MLYTVIATGACTTTYDNQCIRIKDDVEPEQVQMWADKWKTTLPDDCIDQFGDVDVTAVDINNVAEAMPKEWEATVVDEYCYEVFI